MYSRNMTSTYQMISLMTFLSADILLQLIHCGPTALRSKELLTVFYCLSLIEQERTSSEDIKRISLKYLTKPNCEAHVQPFLSVFSGRFTFSSSENWISSKISLRKLAVYTSIELASSLD
jgi:hypothetical protein